MPFTPFHFGPGAAIHALAPKQVSFLAFCTANVLIDIEPLHAMLTGQERLHAFFHTYVGATLVAMATVLLFLACRWVARRAWLPNPFGWQTLPVRAVALGAAVGTCSHIVFDSIMHTDITPFAPFSDANPLFRIVSLSALHWLCLASAGLGLLILGVRQLGVGQDPR